MIRTIIIAIGVLLIGSSAVEAQSIASFRNKLSQPNANNSYVYVQEYGTAAEVIRNYDSPKSGNVDGYRIRIFVSNNQTARQDAIATQDKFDEEYPDIPTYLDYQEPSFIVTVGNCLTFEEALVLQNKVIRSYPTAFLWKGQIPISEIIKEQGVVGGIEIDSILDN